MVRVLDDQGAFVKKRGLSLLERYPVLPQVRSSLSRVPIETQLSHSLHRSYIPKGVQRPCLAPPFGASNTGVKLRSSIACAGFVSFISLFDGAAAHLTDTS